MTGSGLQTTRQKRIARQAASWHARMLEPASEREVEAFEAWLDVDPAHGEAYAQVESLSALSSRLPRRLLANPPPAQWQGVLRPAFAVAAAVMLIVASSLVLTGQGRQAAYAAIANPGPAVRGFRLIDGTIVTLDSGARLAVSFRPDARIVTVQSGRARFNVASDARRSFSIRAANAIVRTSAAVVDVERDDDDVKVLVLDGQVDLLGRAATHDRKETLIPEGKAARMLGRQLSEIPVDPNAARWPEARLAFDNATLATIAGRANRTGRPKIEWISPAIGNMRLTGVLDIRDTRALARKLAATLDLQIEEYPDRIRLTRPSPR